MRVSFEGVLYEHVSTVLAKTTARYHPYIRYCLCIRLDLMGLPWGGAMGLDARDYKLLLETPRSRSPRTER